MSTAIDVFTVFGSVLGIAAFFMGLLKSTRDYNLSKWEAIIANIDFQTLDDFADLAYGGVINMDHFLRLKDLNSKIRKNDPSIRFRGLSGKRIRKKLTEVGKLSDGFLQEISTNRWKSLQADHIICVIDKKYIRENTKTREEEIQLHISSLRNAYKPINEIYQLFKEINDTVNRLPHEMLYKK